MQKRAHGKNKIHINVEEFSKELAISSCLEERLTHNFGVPYRKKTRPRKTFEERIKLAEDYEKLIEDGSFKTRAELARHLGVSRAWITKMMNTLKIYRQS
jgi:transcriptional antiterminator